MSGLKKFLKRKGQKSKLSLSTENVNDGAGSADGEMASVGYFIAKEKDLPKLHKAVWSRDLAKVKQLVKKGDINQLDRENRTPLHLACAQGNEEIARFLLTNKAKTNLCDNMGRTPLMKAVECQFIPCVEALLEYHAECNVIDVNNSTPLHLAAANGDTETALLLIEREAKVNSQDKEGFAPLHVAASLGNQEFVTFLLHEGATLDSTDLHGRTPLMTAASEGHIGIVKVLLQNGSNTNLKDKQGWKASDHAIIHGHHSCANVIDEHDERHMENAKQTAGSGAKPPGKKADLSSLLGTGTTDVEFAFGGPAPDLGGDNSVSAKDDESAASHQSDAENSWESSGDEMFDAKPKGSKPSLMAALKPVARQGSNASTHSAKDTKSPTEGLRSRIPVPSGSPVPPKKLAIEPQTKPGGSPSPSKSSTPFHLFAASSTKKDSKIPSPEVKRKTPGAENGTLSQSSTKSPVTKQKEGANRTQLPSWEEASGDLTVSDDDGSESDFSDSAVLAALSGDKPPTLSSPVKTSTPMATANKPKGVEQARSSELPKLDLGSSVSEVSNPDISGLSDTPGTEDRHMRKQEKAKPVDNDFSDGSDVSGWDSSDDILPSDEPGTGRQDLGLSSSFNFNKPHKNELQQAVDKRKQSVDKQEMEIKTEAKKAAELRAGRKSSDLFDSDEEMTETESEWERERNEKKKAEKNRLNQLQREELERIEAQKQLDYEAEIERKKEDERRKEWEKMEREREEAMAREIQEELERELEQERKEREEEEARRKEEEMKERIRIQEEAKQRRADEERRKQEEKERLAKEAAERRQREEQEQRQAAERQKREEEDRRRQEEEKIQREQEAANRRQREEEERRREAEAKKLKEEAERMERERIEERRRMEEELKRIEKEREEERRRIEQEKEEELERQMRLKEEEMMKVEKEKEQERKRNEEEMKRLEREREEERIRLAQEKEDELERQMRLKEQEMELQKKAYQEQLEKEKRDWDERRRKEQDEKERLKEESRKREEEQRKKQEELMERQRLMKEEEDRLLEEYRKKQERLLEQERRFEEEMARREKELENRRFVEPSITPGPAEVGEMVNVAQDTEVFAEVSPEMESILNESGELEELRRSFELNLEREKAALEESVKRRQEEERRAEEAAQRLRHQQEQLRRQEEEWKVKQQWSQQVRKEEQEARRLEEALRCKRAEEDMLQSQQKAKRMEAEEEVIRSRMEIEKMQLQELEAKKVRLDQQATAKLAELTSKQRREELDHKSRQILQEREQLSASYQAARMRTSEMAQQPRPGVNSGGESVDSNLSDLDLTEEREERKEPLNDKDDKNLVNGHLNADDWSESTEEFEHDEPLPGIQASGIAGLNYVSPSRVQSPPMKALNTSPLKASTSIFSPTAFSPQDPQSLARLQEALRDSKRQIDRLKEKNTALELSRKKLENEVNSQQGDLEVLALEHKEAERAKMEGEVELRNLRYKHEQESEARRVAESLLHQLKEQIQRSEGKLEREMEARQKIENKKRHLVTENKNLQNTINQLETDVNDLKQALTEEQEARALQTELYNQQKKQNEVLLEESRHTAQQKTEVMYQLEAVDQTRKIHEVSSDNLREELKKAEVSLAETKATLEATRSALGKEIELLKEKLQKKSEKLLRAEEQLSKTKEDFDSHVVTGKNEHQNLSTKLESETMTRSRMESEVMSLKARLENANKEMERLEKSRAEAERSSNSLRDELYKAKLKLEKESASNKEISQALTMRLEAAENRASNAEMELQTANVGLAERAGQLNLLQREIDQKKSHLEQLTDKLAREKEQATKMSAKFDNTNDRISRMQSENESLRMKLDDSHNKLQRQEEATTKAEEKFHSMLVGLRSDFEKSKQAMTEKQENLLENIERLKDDLVRANDKHSEQEKEIKQLQQELNESTRKLASSEAALEMQIKSREDLEDERVRLREHLMDLEQRLSSAELAKDEASSKSSKLENQLEHSLRYGDVTKERLGAKQQDVESVARTLAQLERVVMRLKVEKAQVEAALKEENAKCDLLMKEIKDTNEARRSLEALLSNIKNNNVELEEKIQTEALTRVQQEREAGEAKSLWEAEVRARNKLGSKITELETQVEEARYAVDEEKRKTRKALETKKSLEARLEAFDLRSEQHQKEVVALKTQMKTYKRRLREYESSESRVSIVRAEFDKERAAMDSHIVSLRRQVEHLNERLREEMETRSRVELTGKQQQQELSAAKSHEKNLLNERDTLIQANRRLELELDRIKSFYENNFVEKGQLEAHKQELEAKSRFELNRKLEEVNAHLEEQALARDALDKIRDESESKTKKELEQSISELKTQLAKTRAGLYEGQTQKETLEAEARRYKDLYEGELKVKDKLTNRLSRANDRIAESKALLNLERSRRGQYDAVQTSPSKFPTDPLNTMFRSPSPTSPDRMYSRGEGQLMKAVENELSKSIKRHLDAAPTVSDLDLKPSLLNSGTEFDSNPYSPLASSSRQYMSVLKKNYFV